MRVKARSPLHNAASEGHIDVVKLLLERADVDVNLTDTVYDRTPLSWAAECGHDGMVKLLSERGAKDSGSSVEQSRTEGKKEGR
jgi:ankyrin repeat protein